MGSPSELRLHYKPTTTGGCSGAAQNPPAGDQPEPYQKLEEFLARLEEERRKIELLKRELPLCMQLLNGAMETYKQQLEMYQAQQGSGPVLEEFMPLKSAAAAAAAGEEPIKPRPAANVVACEKATWMTSAQLWNPTDGAAAASQLRESDHRLDAVPRIALDHKQRGGGAFLPFSRDRGSVVVLPQLALAGGGGDQKEPGEKKCSSLLEAGRGEGYGARGGGSSAGTEQGKASAGVPASAAATASDGGPAAAAQTTQRKARRCWSPELHRRFVNALQMLGGSQVATPKQIRELMKVDGLTNDEVKSHLQKYRLHTRRPIPAPQAGATAAAPQLVVLGGIWVPPEYAATAAAAAPAIYGHPPPVHYCAAPVPRDFYAPPPPQAAHQHQESPSSQRHRVAAEATPFAAMPPAVKVKRRSPHEPDARERGDDSDRKIENNMEEKTEQEEEEEEDGARSDSSGWKHGDEKALIPVAEAGEVSNGSDVVLKF